ncbi:STAS domain-containing protein [Anaerosalibacter massiliensis]|uniref:Anti-sigma factor antagonist n=1 Tax=Anaerosalibacter massiliensis TaxID=1347392 RepID=A0A9X2S5M7_9FIRM|nr:STAS domain-containing protein [Anaerosalibacter massiliensis]MCR2044489.1 STAS domain-containing protein [Anaerosalibacter massiliensis]
MEKNIIGDDKIIISISGDLTVDRAISLRKDLLNYIAKGYNHIVADVTNLDFIDSTGLGVLVATNKIAHKKNGEVSIKGLKGSIKTIFRNTRLDKVFHICG